MMIILFTLPLALGLLDLLFALIAMALIAVTDAALRRKHPSSEAAAPRRLAGVTLILLFAMHLLGSIVAGTTTAGTGSFTRCLSWPLWELHDIDRFPALQMLRIAMAVMAIVLIAALVVLSARRPALRPLPSSSPQRCSSNSRSASSSPSAGSHRLRPTASTRRSPSATRPRRSRSCGRSHG
ncbi:COX15/CtaA family protein [Tessaracoccus coleopterorum]|uniref:hypothetical protein n=1 Tax=Tessaracoccus coleopterorum TaxID=2714950 RepID=UPI001E41F38F|nr:hypothetical protein [Tessaracoccus coleopterorum]